MTIRCNTFSAIFASALAFSSLWAMQASAKPVYLPFSSPGKSVSIYSNSGGSIGHFAFRAAKLRNSRTLVKFEGRCDSACTLFLGLPSKQTCISKGAFFRFHAPKHPSAQAARYAKNYMMRKYPGWVRSWIGQNRGLSGRLITMNYKYASRFIPPCVTA
jgi:hypothetical protein